jgi:integrase
MGSITKWKGSKYYYIRYDLPPGPNGERRVKTESTKSTKLQVAKDLLRQREEELHKGTYVDATELTFGEYMHAWLKRAEHNGASQTSLHGYNCNLKNHIIPGLGTIKLQRLSPLAIQTFYDNLSIKGLSAKTIRNIHGVIHVALDQALKMQMIQRNPATAVEPPKLRKSEVKAADIMAVKKVLDEAKGTPYYTPICIALATGLRRGEVCGLQWGDFDQKRSTLTVRRSLAQAFGEVHVKTPKNNKARVVPIPPTLHKILLEHKQWQADTAESIYICTNRRGEVITPNGLGAAISRLCTKANTYIHMHGLRHSQATELIASGAPVKAVSERLGHSTVQITQDIYTHVLPHTQQALVGMVEDLLQQVLE